MYTTSIKTPTSTDLELQKDYERQIIMMLVGNSEFKQKSHILNHTCAEMFIDKTFRTIYTTIAEMFEQNIELYSNNIIERLSKEEQKRLIVELDREYITARNCNFYLEKLKTAYINRLLVNCTTLAGYKEIEKLQAKYSLKANTCMLANDAQNLIVDYYTRWETQLKTGYPSIDEKIGSLCGGDLLILAAQTGMGKTCFTLNMITKIAKSGKKVLFFSFEMSLAQMQNRIISAETGINAAKIRNFTMTEVEIEKYYNYANSEAFKSLNIEVCKQYQNSIEEIKAIVAESNADIVAIDYLGLIKGGSGANRYEKITEISRELKLLALETNKPFIVLHQLKRIDAARTDKRPLLSDLRDSGAIEQDADFVCFLYRPAYYVPTEDETKLEFIIAKSRHSQGQRGVVLRYNSALQRITDPQGESQKEIKQCSLNYSKN